MNRFEIVPLQTLQVRKTPALRQLWEHWDILLKKDRNSTKSFSLDPYHSHVSTSANASSRSQ